MGLASDSEASRAFVSAVAESYRIGAPPAAKVRPRAEVLLATLLETSLVDAGPELRQARIALESVPSSGPSLSLLGEPPPWPPASIARMKAKADGEELLAILARQVAPEPESRAWLLSAFEEPPRPVDLARLDAIASAAGGRLVAEPRFRAWLGSEWRAWARQRDRRVARRLDLAETSP